jgi:aspartate/methionine/tyrosine aminotransferase
MFPERFSNLPAYPFARLRNLLDPIQSEHVALTMTIGEPTHAFPSWIIDIIAQNAVGFNSYPPNEGSPELRSAICDWAKRRYRVDLDTDRNVIVLNGTREGLYNAAMALCPEKKNGAQPVILTPNPFYQVYMFAALSVGARSEFVPATRETGFLPDYTALPSEILNQTALAYICSPANPQGAVADEGYWKDLIGLAEKHDFKILADECYSEIYRKRPPVGALEIAADMGADPERVVIFHSLSKRSNLPGLRSGFAAGGEKTITQLKTMRAYSGAPLPLPLQRAAEAVWADEAHVIENRALYEEKFKLADDILGNIAGVSTPEAGFFLWLPYRDGEEAAVKLWREEGLRVLPGRYLAQDVNGQNPGHNYIRVALVADKAHTEQGLLKIRRCLYNE